MTTTIELDGIEITVTGIYTPATLETIDEPSYPAEFQIDEMKIGIFDVTRLLEDKMFEIEEIVINQIQNRD